MLAKLMRPRVLVSGVVVLVAAFTITYFTLFNTDSPSKLSLHTKGSTAAIPTGDLTGTWTVADGSVAGYRVREKLAALPAPSDAVGRTGAITGQVTITGRGAHAGESGTIERFTGSVIPSAAIRTDSGQMHHVRTIDIDLSRREP